jgi:hypothetical protein
MLDSHKSILKSCSAEVSPTGEYQLFKMDLCSSDNIYSMATTEVTRLAPVTARDGVDTRTKDNQGSAAAVNWETTRSGAGDREQDGSNAAAEFDAWLASLPHVRLDLVAPAGAEVAGAPIWGAWGMYETVAKRRMEDSDESFRWVSYETQRQRAEDMLIAAVSEDRQMDMVYLNNLNREIVYMAYAIGRARRELSEGLYPLEFYQLSVLARQKDVEEARAELAVRRIQEWFRSLPAPACRECGAWRCQEDGCCEWCIGKEEQGDRGVCACGEVEYIEGMCADCFWEEDARDKRERRALRPPPCIRIPPVKVEESEEEEDDNSHMFKREGWGPRVYE